MQGQYIRKIDFWWASGHNQVAINYDMSVLLKKE